MLDVLLALNGRGDAGMALRMNQDCQAVARGEAVSGGGAVLGQAMREVARHAAIERAAVPVRQDIDPAALCGWDRSWREVAGWGGGQP